MPEHHGAERGSRPRAHGPVEGGCSLDDGDGGRFFLCALCRRQALICSHCDRGQIYCAGDCRRAAPALLVIDEVGYLSYSNRHADMLFELINRRYEAKSTVVTTNRPFSAWHEVFPGAACVVSLVDRLVHNAEVIAIDGDSYRLKEATERADRRARQRKTASS